MKTYKRFGIAAAAWAALMCVATPSAVFADDPLDGDIWYIGRAPDDAHGMNALSMDGEHLTAGQEVRFRFRLLNRDWAGKAAGGITDPINWLLWYCGPFPTNAYPQLKVGVWINGKRKWADVVENKISPVYQNDYFSDLICSYTVESGDFGILTLAAGDANNPVPASADPSLASEYCLLNNEFWKIVDYKFPAATNVCNFKFTSKTESDDNMDAIITWPTDLNVTRPWPKDIDMSQAGFYIKTVDFDDSTFNTNGIWRQIAAGSTSSYINEGKDKRAPILAVPTPGGVADRNGVTLYAWTADETIARMNTESEETFADGVSRHVARIRLDPKDVTKAIPGGIYAIPDATNKETTVFLCATPTNIFRNADTGYEVMITNFVTCKIRVGPPEPPSIVVKVQNVSEYTATAESPMEVVPVSVGFDGVDQYSAPLPLTVTAAMVDPSSTNNAGMFIGLSTNDRLVTPPDATSVDVTIAQGDPSAIVYAYVKRANDDDTTNPLKGISISAIINDAAALEVFGDRINPATLHIDQSKPVISSIEFPDPVPAGEPNTMMITFTDAVGEVDDKYALEYTVNGSWNSAKIADAGLPSTGVGGYTLSVTNLIFNQDAANALFRIVNKDGVKSEPFAKPITVFAKPIINARPYNHVGEDGNPSPIYNEGDLAYLTLTLDDTPFQLAEKAWIFLVPLDEKSSNLVETTAFTRGIPIQRTQTETQGRATLRLLDGADPSLGGTELRYGFEIWNNEDKTAPTADRLGLGTDGYASGEFTLTVNNVKPRVQGVKMAGVDAPTDGTVHRTKVAQGVLTEFKASNVLEPGAIDKTNVNFQVQWEFFNKDGARLWGTNTVGNPYAAENAVWYAFPQEGTNSVTVTVKDKDIQWEEVEASFTFKVETLGKPVISLKPYHGSDTFLETDIGEDLGRIDVYLNIAPTEDVTVKIDVERATPSDTMLPVLDTHYIQFAAGATEGYFYFDDLDGTRDSRFIVKAAVTNETEAPNSGGKPWSEYYQPAQRTIKVSNMPPVIDNGVNNSSITNYTALNVPYEITWELTDALADMTNSFQVIWQVQGATVEPAKSYYTNATDVVFSGTSIITFTQQGQPVRRAVLQVVDKDNGRSEQREYIFLIDPQKPLVVVPLGPEQKAQTRLSGKYLRYLGNGLGGGRVWADGALSTIESFWQTWNYEPNNTQASVFGYGYRAGEQDDGHLEPVAALTTDRNLLAINQYGNQASGAPWYTADFKDIEGNAADSFFYCWIGANEDGEEGGGSNSEGVHLGPLAPARGTNVLASAGRQSVKLGESEDEENPKYNTVTVEAVFSTEYYHKDNVGDINWDGIPDIYAVNYDWRGGLLFEAAEGTLEDGGDLKSLTEWNGDTVSTQIGQAASGDTGDFLPSMTSAGSGSLIPNIQSSWALYGQPFTAYLEIRGFGDGLNFRRDKSRTQGPNSAGEWIGERDFTEVESNAWATVYGSDPDWTPENRTDPTIDDTDGDGLPDGYEYYFWYYAYVGDPETGTRLTGERFNLEDIAVGIPLTADDVAAAFNPNVKSGKPINERDTDGDGLTDLEEFAIGTNPIHWDTDGDGISDYWEVMNGLNPLVVENDTTTPNTNPDKDYMAWAEVGKTYALVTLPDGNMFAVPNNGGALERYFIQIGDDKFLLEEVTNNVAEIAIPVYRYGNAKSTLVPKNRGGWDSETKSGLNGEIPKAFTEFTCTSKPLDVSAIDWGEGIEVVAKAIGDEGEAQDDDPAAVADEVTTNVLSNVAVQFDQTLTLVHEQVRAQYGFDPRTGWNMNVNGYCVNRWDPNLNPVHARRIGPEAGRAVNTKPYSNLDEYLLLKYRYMTTGGAPSTNLGRDLAKDKADYDKKATAVGKIFSEGTTKPNIPFADKTYGNNEEVFEDSAHGADTDGDGVPDGWELYVGFNPNYKKDGIVEVDGDTLALAREYAGTDSCAVYETAATSDGVATIYENHPGVKTGWYNKFFPTDPWNGDTDGDNIDDATEGGSWRNRCVLNNAMSVSTGDGGTYTFTFIYGEQEDKGELCIRGGGMNPCSVDTDFDLLPDPWEMSFAGVRAEGGVLQGASFGESVTKLLKRTDGNPKSQGVYITGGMDATFGVREDNATFTGDAYTNPAFTDPRTGTVRNFDFDQDGLQNFQEYLVQALRHLRYDDSETPLMGSWMPGGTPSSRKFLGFLPMNIMDGETFYAAAKDAGFVGGGAWQFRELGYFARPPHEWDPTALIPRAMSKYDATGYRVMLPPHGLGPNGRMDPVGYASTDPRTWDTDLDSMGDYYEIFHGLNPLLGSIADPMDISGDVIARAYNGSIAFWMNAWTGWPMLPQEWLSGEAAYRDIDAIKYPWMLGTPEADADGDGIRNIDEALVVNMTSPQPTHTDPTPLWFTDSTALNKASYTSQYYLRDEELDFYSWRWAASGQTGDGAATEFLFSFEENEGYDTDHDWLSDSDERHRTATPISDPLKFTDPDRRQAIWFPGENSAAVSYSANFHRLFYASYDLLRQFTVEAWIKPDVVVGRDQVILERTSIYGASTLSNNMAQARANFRIGIREDGRLYGLFDTSDAVTTGEGDGTAYVLGLEATTNWTHVALTFNGQKLTLYINKTPVGTTQTAQIPANGLIDFVEDAVPNMSNFPVLNYGYRSVPCAVVLGARVTDTSGLEISDKSSWAVYGSFYSGYLDEVRVWDGARTADEIEASWKKRFSFADVSAERESIYQAWKAGATRNDNDGYANLPAELLMCYNFQTLPGATDAASVAWEPSGFTKNVRNVGKVEGNNVSGDIFCGWWYGTPVRSTVYRNWRIVPWIPNMVGHLPLMDGSTLDSQYWSEFYGGMTVPGEMNLHSSQTGETVGLEKIIFPNTANPYPYYIFTTDRLYHQFKLDQMVAQGILPEDVQSRYAFELRTSIVGSSDLVPLGGAFAKRCEDMWDGQGAADGWMMTKRDTNANGIPDWWEAVAKANYGAPDGFGWDTIVTYDGLEMTAREAYLRDVQKGMQPDGSVDETFVDIAGDLATGGLPTWWRNLTGLTGGGADDDDNDGLSNYMEYLLSEGDTNAYPRVRVNPVSAFTFAQDLGQIVPDYFLRAEWQPGLTNYLGAMVMDHDFMENSWEDSFDANFVSRALYDAWKDADDDGWSNFAEARAGSTPSRQNEVGVDGYQIPGHPVPDIALSLNNADGSVFSPGQTIRVQAYHDGKLDDIPSAKWTVSAGGTQERFLGVNSGRKVKLTLGPGAIKQGTVSLEFKSPVWYQHQDIYRNGIRIQGSSTYSTMSAWQGGAHDIPFAGDSTKGGLYWGGSVDETIGTVDYITGEVEFDFALCNGGSGGPVSDTSTTAESGDVTRIVVVHEFPSDKAWFKISWTGVMASGNTRQTLRLSEPEAAQPGVSAGMLREGKTTFVAYIDEDGNGSYTQGEPYGVAANVDVGWFGTSCAIELSRTAPQMARVPLEGSGETRLRVVRALMNGEALAEETLTNRMTDVTTHPLLSEADLLAAGELDLDWGTLANAWLGAGNANIAGLTNATYTVLTGDGEATLRDAADRVLVQGTPFSVRFEAGLQQTLATPVEPLGGKVYAGSPTFRWTHANSIGKSYPAFRLRVWGADGETLVYDSGAQKAPSRNSQGVYEWTAPIYAGMVTPQGVVFETGTAYRWTVSMLDAKFTEPNGTETKGDFTLACTGDIRDGYGYGSIDVAVKYFGPLAEVLPTDVTQFTNLVRVQAFESPDFTGVPAGEAFVTNVADIASIASLEVNARLMGLKPGSYYVRAFIDTDADLAWSQWETWGYCNYVGTEEPSVYTPRAVTVAAGVAVPVATVYMEVADTNNNGEPDDWEWNERGTLGATRIGISAAGTFELPEDGGALLDPAQELDGLDLTLKPAPLDPVTLKLTLESLTGELGNLPIFADATGAALEQTTNDAGVVTTYLTDVTDSTLRVRLLDMDGTADSSYLVTATATNALDRYRPGEFRLTVTNNAPTIAYSGSVTNDSPTNAVFVAVGDSIEIPLTVNDVAADLAAGLNVYWMGEGLVALDGATVETNEFGVAVTNGLTLVTNRLDTTFHLLFQGGSSGLRSATFLAEDKDGGVSTREFWYYVLAPQDDYDGDGLSNHAEWRAIEAGFLPSGSYTNACSDGVTPDYWHTVTVDGVRRYLGELFADHDHMDNYWEDAYDVFFVNSAVWDAVADGDGDGWSNWSEAAALTDPSLEKSLSLVSASSGDDQALPAYPVPTVRVKAMYEGASDAFNGALVVKAWHGSTLSGMPDAKWTISGPKDATASCSRFLGVNPNRKVKFNLGPGMIAEQHCAIQFFDPLCEHWTYQEDGKIDIESFAIDSSHWHGCTDRNWWDDPTDHPNGATSAAFGYGFVDYRTGDVEIDFTKFQDDWFGISIGDNQVAYLDLRRSFVRVSWRSRVVSTGTTREMHLSIADDDSGTRGFLREGETAFIAFADANGNGEWDPGEPFGVTRGVQVGWDEVSEVAIELKDDADGMRFVLAGEGIQRVRVVRTAINGQACPARTVWSRTVDLDIRNWFTEADFVKAGTFDFDWTYLCEDAATRLGLGPADIESATYEVYGASSTNGAAYVFTRTFDGTRTVPVALSPSEADTYAVYTTRPTFRWSGSGSATAFQIQIAKDADFSEIVWDSGTNFLAVGRIYTAPAYVGAELEDGTAYYWRVAEYNARDREAAGFWSAPAKFETRVDTRAYGRVTGYGGLALDVRYYGSATNDASNVVVAVYRTADFAGMPVARARLAGGRLVSALTNDLSAVATINDWWLPATNVAFSGIAPGSYYAMAFIDLDGDGVRAAYEPWGYVSTDNDLCHPAPLLVDAYVVVPPSAVIVMEDTDLNGDDVPDCLQDLSVLASAAPDGTGVGENVNDSDADGLSDAEEDEQGTEAMMWDTDGDGMPDGWETKFAGSDPATADSDDSVAGDVMAYAVTNLTVITVWDGASEISATNRYVVMDSGLKLAVGDDVASLAAVLRRVYDYAGNDGLGRAADAAELVGRRIYAVAQNAEVALVHAQVYEFFGFSPYTANPAVADEDAVNTKPFTALDKYLVCRYLEQAYGLADEVYMNTNRLWSAYTLKPGNPDNDRDGVPDGWELYVMFGTEGATADLASAKISPFSYDDARGNAPAAGSQLTVLQEFDGGNMPTDPWQTTTAELGLADITDFDAYTYHLKTAAEQLSDEDNDGLSNYTEYLIKVGFAPYGFRKVDYANAYTFRQLVPDYFMRVGRLYLGEMFTDHDFMEDGWEDAFDADAVSRFMYDAWDDPDNDGWSNWAECRAGTNPTLVTSPLMDGESMLEVPIPAIHLKATYANLKSAPIPNVKLVVQAFGEGRTDGAPDAVWRVSTDTAQSFVRNLGANNGAMAMFNLGGGVVPGTVRVEFRDPNAMSWKPGVGAVWLQPSATAWQQGLTEYFELGSGQSQAKLVRVTGESPVGTVDYAAGKVSLDFTRLQDYLFVSGTLLRFSEEEFLPNATNEYVRIDLAKSFVRISWNGQITTDGRVWETSLGQPNVSGLLREGKTMFVVFADTSGDGLWTAGEPYGVVKDVDVGWAGTDVEVELTDTAVQLARIDLLNGISAADFAAANVLTDRGVTGQGEPNIESQFVGTNAVNAANARVRVVRSYINGLTKQNNGLPFDAVLFDKTYNLASHPALTEADILNDGKLDLDWFTLTNKWGTSSIANLTNATYRVVFGNGPVTSTEYNNLFPVLFVNTFEKGSSQTPAVPVTPKGNVYRGSPTFSWTHTNRIDKAYPAFRLRVWKSETGGTPIYDSQAIRAPLRDSSGVYSWTAPLYANMVLPGGNVFSTTNNYWWSVSMLDAKFTGPNANETRQKFRMEASGELGTISDYGAIDVAVRYYGPSPALSKSTDLTKIVRVQAFTTPDFTGSPAGEGHVTSVSCIDWNVDLRVNAQIMGLKSGTYYVRAFLDTDGNGKLSRWSDPPVRGESWGYYNYVGTENPALYTPRAVTLVPGSPAPEILVIMEDMDGDNDGLPDSWEWGQSADHSLDALGSPTGNTFFTRVNTNLVAELEAYDLLFGGEKSGVAVPRLMMALLGGGNGAATSAAYALLGSGARSGDSAGEGEKVTVRIESFSLGTGLKLSIETAVPENVTKDGVQPIFTIADSADVSVILVAAKSPDFSDARETEIRRITIKANAEAEEVISAEELKAVIDEAGFGDAAFFKVKLQER